MLTTYYTVTNIRISKSKKNPKHPPYRNEIHNRMSDKKKNQITKVFQDANLKIAQ
jgi:hypothetical protein